MLPARQGRGCGTGPWPPPPRGRHGGRGRRLPQAVLKLSLPLNELRIKDRLLVPARPRAGQVRARRCVPLLAIVLEAKRQVRPGAAGTLDQELVVRTIVKPTPGALYSIEEAVPPISLQSIEGHRQLGPKDKAARGVVGKS
jgi:hypothetical protein